jgi:hypothetical protein
VLHKIGVAVDMDELAKAINRGEVRPGRLAYLIDDSPMPARQGTQARGAEMAAEQTMEAAPEKESFVERFAPAARSQASFTERVDAGRVGLSERAV